MKLVEGWKQSWKWLSVQYAGLSAVALTAWLALPEDLKSAVPDEVKAFGAYLAIGAAVLARLIQQEKK